MRTLYTVLMIAAFLIFAANKCKTNEEDTRDRLVFIDSYSKVEQSIMSHNALMQKLPADKVSNYFFDNDDILYVNSHRVGNPDALLPDTIKAFEGLSNEERKAFISNALFLKRNKISGGHLEGIFNTWVYSYSEIDDKSFNMYRGIFYFDKTTPLEDIKQAHIILDMKGNLILFKGDSK